MWRGTVCPSTSPDWVFSAAKSDSVPCRWCFESVSLGAAGRERQHGIEAVKRLNGRLLVNGEDRRVVRRIDVQADHLGGLRLEVRIVRLHVPLEPVRLEARALPRFRHEVVMNLEYTSPVCGSSSACGHQAAAAASSPRCGLPWSASGSSAADRDSAVADRPVDRPGSDDATD